MKVISTLLFLLFFQGIKAQPNWVSLEKKWNENLPLLGENAVILISNGDSILFKKEAGSFTSKTAAPIASCSKWLTAALVMQFVDEGKISLEDRVQKYLPGFDLYFKDYITIRHCLSHMTGIRDDEKFLRRILERRKFSSLEEEVEEFMKREIRAKAGTDFWYGSIGLNIAGRILEVISKKKFEVLIKTKLFQPLGMTKTSFTPAIGQPVNPSGGAVSTADDYMKFLVMLLQKGTYKGQKILSEKAVEEMMKPQNTIAQVKFAPKSAEGYTYALGSWVLEEKKAEGTNKATVLASPGLFGTWPMMDYCRGYAYLVFVKNILGAERADIHEEMKKLIDLQIKSGCR